MFRCVRDGFAVVGWVAEWLFPPNRVEADRAFARHRAEIAVPVGVPPTAGSDPVEVGGPPHSPPPDTTDEHVDQAFVGLAVDDVDQAARVIYGYALLPQHSTKDAARYTALADRLHTAVRAFSNP